MKYDTDPRVKKIDRGYTVEGEDGTTYYVMSTEPFNWCVCHGPNLDFVPVRGGGFAIGFINPDDAIRALIGEPRTVGRR